MSENRPDTPAPERGPLFARAARLFYSSSFDVRSRKAMSEAMSDFVEMEDSEQRFHVAHLLFRQVQGLEAVHELLGRVEARLARAEASRELSTKHLRRIRDAVEELAQGGDLDEADEVLAGEFAEDGTLEPEAASDGPAAVAPPEEIVELLVDGQVVELEEE